MALVLLETKDRKKVRRVRRIVRHWFGLDAEMVFGESTDNVLEHNDDSCAVIHLHASHFSIRCSRTSIPQEGLRKFITSEDRQGGYGLLLIVALGGDLHISDDGSWVEWRKERSSEELAALAE